ncbi:DUF1917-domain-containing protein [Decorospora gaudefroyi]|uniref:DUF1917-domain-containing protein n=1 Tax=Decorospora gaudefroyi TaxID=184978 RepID=A0A6A5KMN9_9PLEO|nr:DUF1917-domain-containing protein [Decorospora gaudefroyi]
MAEEMVSAEGWISDESSFYGDEDEQDYLRDLCEDFNPKSFWRVQHKNLNIVAFSARSQLKSELLNPRQAGPDAWQLGESVHDFIERLPPLTTSTSTCPWIWANNPHRDKNSPSPRVGDFTERGMELLKQSLQTRRDILEEGSKGPKATVTERLNQESKLLKQRIAALAEETYVLTGKWMLFPNLMDVTRIWKQVVAGVIDNRLGCGSKVATDNGEDARLICVYTQNFQDANDVARVLYELETMGLVNADRAIYYKPDAYTYLDLKRGTAAKYGLQASMYNSRSMMAASKLSKLSSMPQKKKSTLNKFF